jgi:ATP-dependent protease ClpP protease subunit
MIRKLFIAVLLTVSAICFAAPSLTSNLLVLNSDNHATLNGEIDGKLVSDFLKSFTDLNSNRRLVYISSPGGSVMDGMKLIQAIRDEKVSNKNIRVICYVDEAASMAFAIVQAICDERHGGITSTLMQHQATYGVQGSDNQIVSRLKMISSVLKVLDGIQAKRIGISIEELRRRSADEWWTVGQEAVDARVLDNLSSVVCSKDLIKATREEKFSNFLFGSGTVVFSKCPLIYAPLSVKMNDGKPANELVKQSFKRVPLSERVIEYK